MRNMVNWETRMNCGNHEKPAGFSRCTSRMTGDSHVRFCERLGVQVPGPTRPRGEIPRAYPAVKRRAIRARQVWIREMSESYPSDEASKLTLDDTKTGVFTLFWERHGRYLLTGHAVSGVEKA